MSDHSIVLVSGRAAALLLASIALAGSADAAFTGRVSVGAAGVQATNQSAPIAVSADGRSVAFWSSAANLPGGPGTFVRDRIAATTVRVGNYEGPGDVATTPDLRFFAHATSLGISIFDRNTSTDTLACAQATSFGAPNPSLSDDGLEVAFQSSDSTLVPGDNNHAFDIFVCSGGVAERMSEAFGGGAANALSIVPAISGDGSSVAFYSRATNLVAPPTSGLWDVFVRDRVTDTTELVSVLPDDSAPGTPTCCGGVDVTPDGRFVAFVASPDDGFSYQAYVRDRTAGTTELVSVAMSGNPAGVVGGIALSDDGRFVVFASNASNFVADDTNLSEDVFLRDRTLGTTTRVSVSSLGAQTGAYSTFSSAPEIAGDGGVVSFASSASDLIVGDTNGATDAFVHDRLCGNGALDGIEACDDGNNVDGDGCDADCTVTGCGNGVVTAGEACDSGAGNGADGCCSASCALVDADGDGTCDALDPCEGPAIVRAGLVLKGASGPNPDKLTFRGRAPVASPVDPMADGLRLLLVDAIGRLVLDAPIAGGAGWNLIGPDSWLYLNPGPNPPSGIRQIKLAVRDGAARFKILGDGGSYASPPISSPLQAVLFFSAAGGECAQSRPACVVKAQGDKLVCRS